MSVAMRGAPAKKIGAVARIFKVVRHIYSARALKISLVAKETLTHEDELRVVAWQRGLVNILGMHVRVHGSPPEGAALYAINHVSWIDPLLLGSNFPIRFVAKEQAKSWPIIGPLLDCIDTLYINRGAHQTARLNEQMTAMLKRGLAVGFFPEATTTAGRNVSFMFPRLFKSAVDANVPVVPVALKYSLSVNGLDTAPYIDNMSFLDHCLGLLRNPPQFVDITYCEPITLGNRDVMADACRVKIANALDVRVSLVQKKCKDIDFASLWYTLRYRADSSR